MSESESRALLGELPPELARFDAEEEAIPKLPSLADVGKRLPIGFLDQRGQVHRDFELADWTWELEEELGEVVEESPEMPVNQYVSEIVGRAVTRIGTIDLTKLKRGERRLLTSSAFLSDVLYLYAWIRIGAIGTHVKLDSFRCPNLECRNEMKNYSGDLRTLEVQTFEDIPKRVVELERGVEYAGKRLRKVTVGPVRWSLMEADDVGSLLNPTKLKALTLQRGILSLEGAPEGPVVFTRDHLRSMFPREVNRLVAEIDRCGGGIVWEVRDLCSRCKQEFSRTIDWRYSSFFAGSSL